MKYSDIDNLLSMKHDLVISLAAIAQSEITIQEKKNEYNSDCDKVSACIERGICHLKNSINVLDNMINKSQIGSSLAKILKRNTRENIKRIQKVYNDTYKVIINQYGKLVYENVIGIKYESVDAFLGKLIIKHFGLRYGEEDVDIIYNKGIDIVCQTYPEVVVIVLTDEEMAELVREYPIEYGENNFVCRLPQILQNIIRSYLPEELSDTLIEEAMVSRFCDLKDTLGEKIYNRIKKLM